MGWRAALLCLAIFVGAWPAASAPIDCSRPGTQWSKTDPPVNLTHIFCGVLHDDDRALRGYHALAGRHTPGEARIERRYAGPNADRVTRAIVCLPHERAVGAVSPCKCSSMFPDDWTVEQVLDAIVTAVKTGRVDPRGFFRGPSGTGFAVVGWLLPPDTARARCGSDLCVATAWPAYADETSGEEVPWFCPLRH